LVSHIPEGANIQKSEFAARFLDGLAQEWIADQQKTVSFQDTPVFSLLEQ